MAEIDIRRINLMMGNKCNFKCRYCIQTGNVADQESKNLSKNTIKYIHHLVNIRPDYLHKLLISFWGGEPLLYWNIIKQTVFEFGDVLDYNIVTNGALLTKDKVDYINEHNISLVVSNDGPCSKKTRGFNVLEDESFMNLFRQVNHKSVDFCLSAYNQDLFSLWNYFEDKLGKDINIFYEPLIVTWDMPKDLYNFDYEAFEKTMNDIVDTAYNELLKGKIGRSYLFLDTFVPRINAFLDGKQIPDIDCCQMRRMINLDLDGNIYACHNSCNKIGTVADDFDDIEDNYYASIEASNLSDCDVCDFRFLCGYGCPYSEPSKGKEACCHIHKLFILGCLKFAKKIAGITADVDLEDSFDI